jgi:hypothetical protein
MKPLLASIMKMPLRAGRVFLVEHQDAGRDAGAVEQVGRQADDALEDAERTSLRRMTASALPRNSTPCGRMQAPLPVLFMRADDVQQVGVVALLGGGSPQAKRW